MFLLLVLWNEILVFWFLGSGFRISEIRFLAPNFIFLSEILFFWNQILVFWMNFDFFVFEIQILDFGPETKFWILVRGQNFGFWSGDKILDFGPGTEFWIFVRNGILDFDLGTKFRWQKNPKSTKIKISVTKKSKIH